MIELYLLEQIDAFARFGTLSEAARTLHISQPALTRSMRKVEELMGIPLFHRDKRKLTFNAAGRVVAEYARRILEAEQEMELRAVEADRREHTVTLGACAVVAVNHLIPLLTQCFRDKSILTEMAPDDALVTRLRNRACQLVVLHEPPEDRSIFCQRYFTEQLYISLPKAHPLANRDVLRAEDLKGLSLLTFDVGFWVGLCRRKLPQTAFLVQTDVDAMDELVSASSLPVFNSDRMLEDGYVPEDSVSIMLDEDFARTVYYVACLDAEKDRYASFFSAVRAETIGAQ